MKKESLQLISYYNTLLRKIELLLLNCEQHIESITEKPVAKTEREHENGIPPNDPIRKLMVGLSELTGESIEDSVVDLPQDSDDEMTQVHKAENLKKPTLLLFYMDGCIHCVRFKPTWDEAKHEIRSKGIDTLRIDGIKNKELSQKYGVQGFPTILYFNGKDIKPFDGNQRTKEKLLEFINEE